VFLFPLLPWVVTNVYLTRGSGSTFLPLDAPWFPRPFLFGLVRLDHFAVSAFISFTPPLRFDNYIVDGEKNMFKFLVSVAYVTTLLDILCP